MLLPAGLGTLSAVLIAVGVRRGGWALPLSLVAVAAALVGAARGWVLRIEAGPQRLVLVNWLRVVAVRWAEVARCGCDDDGVWVRRVDGSEVRASAFQHGSRALRFARKPAVAAAAELERIRRRRR
ncbi:hypothetical protein GCM10010168_71430 [Actinoplanes ianthinogenes]|uniref:Low molecular weight protein antigen 6 PH domain-containing protein n=2 Tax=Actinoplanes ianthinogenes TaxID=122358 RepID=A0ABN6CPV4_9ACTN|nr:hypothetical protein Aiant_79250 [Actinoplanes ianthinogenes]GGR42371.1 hypothetical protein GCM10010168_71430 [Actinoplanes ianthinogenes]